MLTQAEKLQTRCQSDAVSVGSLVNMTGPDEQSSTVTQENVCASGTPTVFDIHRKCVASTMFNLDLIFNGNLL